MATKKSAKSNSISLDRIFEICPFPGKSMFEQENFGSTAGAEYSRYVIGVINEIRKIESDLENKLTAFEKNSLTAEKARLLAGLNSHNVEDLESAILNFEESEPEYWVNYLGKRAAIEVLTMGRPSFETMDKMIRLPEELYIKASQLCVKLANAVDAVTKQAEADIGYGSQPVEENDGMPDLSKKKGIKLKKVKK